MPPPERNRWTEWKEIILQRREAIRLSIADWWVQCREEPALVWQTPLVRYITYFSIGLVALLAVRSAAHLLEPPNAKQMSPRARTANFDVICTNPECGRHFVIKRQFSFDAFPVKCPFCKKPTGHLALRCHSPSCRGTLQPSHLENGVPVCDSCDQPLRTPD